MKLNYGNPISEQLQQALKFGLSGQDYEEAAEATGYTKGTAQQLACGNLNINLRNERLLVALLERAISNTFNYGVTLADYAK